MKVILSLCFTDDIVCHYNVNIDIIITYKEMLNDAMKTLWSIM